MKRLFALSMLVCAALTMSCLVAAEDDDADPNELFTQLDKNKDGKITSDEVSEKQKKFFERLLRVGDSDKNKSLSKSEFLRALNPDDETAPPPAELGGNRGGRRQGNPDQIFRILDRNKDGKLTRDELPEQARQRFAPLFEKLGKDELTKEDFAKLRGPGGKDQKRPQQTNGDAAKRAEQYFARLDTNGDGKLSVSEAPQQGKRIVQQMLDRAGKDPKDSLTKAEFIKFAARGGGRPGDRPNQKDRPKSDGRPQRPDGGSGGFRGPAFFRMLDSNQDGKLTRAELARAADLLDKLDGDKNGSLDMRELFGAPGGGRPGDRPNDSRRPQRPDGTDGKKSDRSRSKKSGNRPDEGRGSEFVSRIFKQADKNGDGKISSAEAPARMKERFSRIDANGDGFVDREEMTRAIGQSRGQSKKKKKRD